MLRWLFNPGTVPSGNFAVLFWWEKRRIPYNLLVGAAGLLAASAVFLLASLLTIAQKGTVELPPPLLVALTYALACNVAYCLGWFGEILFFSRAREAGLVFRRRAFALGLALSCSIPVGISGLFVVLMAIARLRT